MKSLETIIRRVFFYVAFGLLVVASVDKVCQLFFKINFLKPLGPQDILDWAVIALIFVIAMQLHQIRLLLCSKSQEPPK